MKKYRIRVGLDVDDTLYDCNAYAQAVLSARYPNEPPLTVDEITGWGVAGRHAEERIALFSDPGFVKSQPILPGAKEFVKTLSEIAEVFFITAVPSACMSERAKRLEEDFPEIPSQNILIGTRKDLIAFDILLDDGAHNISASTAAFPVLFRRPWNVHLSGLLSVNNYDDFLHFCRMAASSFTEKAPDLSHGGILCLVGPSGSGKNEIANELTGLELFEKPLTTTTRPRRNGESENAYRFVTEEEFRREKEKGKFLETTVYSGFGFGTSDCEISPIVAKKHVAVIPIDVCGAITVRNRYPGKTLLVFTDRPKPDVLRELLRREIRDEDKIRRILSLDYEYRNEQLCDLTLPVSGDAEADCESLLQMIRLNM